MIDCAYLAIIFHFLLFVGSKFSKVSYVVYIREVNIKRVNSIYQKRNNNHVEVNDSYSLYS